MKKTGTTDRIEKVLQNTFLSRPTAEFTPDWQHEVMARIAVSGAHAAAIVNHDAILIWRMAWGAAAVTVLMAAVTYYFWLSPAIDQNELQIFSDAITADRVVAAL